MIWQSLLLISSGAALGASLRWIIGLLLNPLFVDFAFGTLIANYLGCFIIGLLIATIWQYPQFSQEWRLFIITGFLGSLTTFSSFSSEVIENFFQHKWLIGLAVISSHLLGCLICTSIGILIVRWLN
ncbi:fluoride efflux transporter CrcB [Pasteurella bettyae]|uniref:Fluoride-specific ion channel FluC n=1 Tax=Pasteurella bettyae CCUG 2042 TaxID=1095749 RepID=I3DBF7_9PAST|nr:fluoride efflux transporter CrcB [Pasteurella bettyae]EIJ69050.1 protein CrcB [Pasteurella bettyae CCUG 2042]SUB22889.1 camphor resistance protein CrcB [Pasteurella bettyae]